MTDIAIIGAGPYGLSLGAHLTYLGVPFRIFGRPMQVWSEHMPQGMKLKSDGFASNLYDPAASCTLSDFCAQNGIPYDDMMLPVDLANFIQYGHAFQQRMVPSLEQQHVTSLRRTPQGFLLQLENGEQVAAKKVVVATGITHFQYIPDSFSQLPPELVSHTYQHSDLSSFKGCEVVVIGGGASSIDTAAILHQVGAHVRVVARRPAIRFNNLQKHPRPLLDQLRAPTSGLGAGWRSRLCTDLPMVFHFLPKDLRVRIVQRHLGPAPGWAVKRQVEGKVPMTLGVQFKKAEAKDGRVSLEIVRNDGTAETITADHVICGTGYRVVVDSLPYLDMDLKDNINQLDSSPELNRNFMSSIPGLYFIGLAAAYSFGPMLRFAYGAGYTARRVSGHLAKRRSRG